ncbi:MAG TPA: hypothetical protein VH442_19890 [Micromonosporaceae bacterium]|jgi:hypothetical protein
MRRFVKALLGAVLVAGALVLPASVASAANPGTPGPIAFIRGGNIFIADGSTLTQLTTGGGYNYPKFQVHNATATSGGIAYLHDGNLFVGFYLVGFSPPLTDEIQLTFDGHGGAGSWNPDGTQLAYQDGFVGFAPLFIVRFGSSTAAATAKTPAALHAAALAMAASARTTVVRPGHATTPQALKAATRTAFSGLQDDQVAAWSPNGKWIAIEGGDCIGIFDSCLTVVDLATNTETTIAAFGGGGSLGGFATTPAWTANSSRLLWTQQAENGDGSIGPTQIWSSSPTGTNRSKVGLDGDSVPAPSPAGGSARLVLTAHNHQAWVTMVAAGGHRTILFQGYNEDWDALVSP